MENLNWPPNERRKVLIADDEPAIRQFLMKLTEALGYVAYAAVDGVEALRMFEIVKPDLLVLDIYMPRMNGLAVMANIRNVAPDCPIIIITGFLHYEQIIQSTSGIGPDGYLIKPINKAQMANLMMKLLEQQIPA
jgi:YesN/AraC family two-component response regulator